MTTHATPLSMLLSKFLVDDGCWPWIGGRNTSGYGVIRRDGKPQQAHRVVYELLEGPIPEGHEPDHLCRNRACVNPAHFEIVTHAENGRRAAVARWSSA